MKLSHNEIKEILPEYAKSSIGEETRSYVESHLKECPDCSGELQLLAELADKEVPDPGDLYWKTLPKKVEAALTGEKTRYFSIKSLWFRMPRAAAAAAAAAALILLIFTFADKEKTPETSPFFKDPFTAEIVDYDDLTETDIPIIQVQLTGDDFYGYLGEDMDYTYDNELASLNSTEMESLLEALQIIPQGKG